MTPNTRTPNTNAPAIEFIAPGVGYYDTLSSHEKGFHIARIAFTRKASELLLAPLGRLTGSMRFRELLERLRLSDVLVGGSNTVRIAYIAEEETAGPGLTASLITRPTRSFVGDVRVTARPSTMTRDKLDVAFSLPEGDPLPSDWQARLPVRQPTEAELAARAAEEREEECERLRRAIWPLLLELDVERLNDVHAFLSQLTQQSAPATPAAAE